MADEMYLTPLEVPICKLPCADAFKKLTKRERLYAHHMSRASWLGAKICLEQTGPATRSIFEMLQLAFSEASYDRVEHDNAEDLAGFYNFCVLFYGNLGNYLSFGDRKFIPRISPEVFEKLLMKHADQLKGKGKRNAIAKLWSEVKEAIYSLEGRDKELGKPHEATSGYYLGDVTSEDVALISRFMESKKLEAWNTRLAKGEDGSLEIRFAAAEVPGAEPRVESHEFEGRQVRVRYGDYGDLLTPVVENLRKAKAFAANPIQEEMLSLYAEHFATGELQKHKESQAAWVKDLGPAVETNIGFIENYRDGYGERAEWEGLVSVVNRDQSKKFDDLVSNAEELLKKLPWPRAFEKDTFMRPDFTALDVVTFASSGIPVGINIPNYDDVRVHHGFKNVHLHNVLSSRYAEQSNVPFISAEDMESFKALRVAAFEVQVGLHELLGHGSGKLLSKADVEGAKLPNPLASGGFIKSFYEEGQTWSGVFKGLASAWEECRAEAVGLYLCLERSVLEIFGFKTEEEQLAVIHCNWLNLLHAAIMGLECYTPETKKWGQAHMHARFAILNTLLRTKTDFLTLDVQEANMDMTITLQKAQLMTVGKKAIGDLLVTLQVLRSSANVVEAEEVFKDLTEVDDHWLKVREIVLKHKKPRPVYVQAHTVAERGQAQCLEFKPNVKGMLLSMQYHFGEAVVPKAAASRSKSEKEEKGEKKGGNGPAKLKRPRFSKVSALNPESAGVNLRLKVLSPPAPVGASATLREATVGDASGSVALTLRSAPDGLLEALNVVGAPLVVRNGKVSMVKGHIRLDVDKWGKIIAGTDGEEESVFAFEPNASNDISAVEYELVTA